MSKYEYIDSQNAEPTNLNSVVKMCRWLTVSTSGFYHWLARPQSATSARREALTARIQLVLVLRDVDGKKSLAAERLRISRGTLYERIRRYRIDNA